MNNNLISNRIEDWIDQATRKNRVINSYFLSMEELAIAKRQIGNRVIYRIIGGHENYERAKILFNSEDEFKADIVLLKAVFDKRYDQISHSDVLGSLMGLNIERKTIGDIYIQDECIYVFTDKKMAKYIIDNCTQIRRSVIKFEISDDVFERVLEFEYLQLNVASLRLDSIVSAITHMSREKAQRFITEKQVSVNHVVLEDVKRICNNNDTISIKRYGRFIFKGIIKVTRKERLLIEVHKYR